MPNCFASHAGVLAADMSRMISCRKHVCALPARPGRRSPSRVPFSIAFWRISSSTISAGRRGSRLSPTILKLSILRPVRSSGRPVEFALFDGETHMSVLPIAINRAIRFAFGPEGEA